MQTVSRKDFIEAELQTVRISTIPTMVVTANGQVLVKGEATENVREMDLFLKVMLLENTPAVLSLGKLCENLCTVTIGPVHLLKKWQENSLRHIKLCTIPCPWFINEFFHFNFSSTYFTPSPQETELSDTEIPAIRRSGSTDELARGDPLHESTETENLEKMTMTKNCRVITCKVCQIGYRSSSMDWLMKVFQNIETLPVLLMSDVWSREQKWYRVNTTCLFTSRKTGIAMYV